MSSPEKLRPPPLTPTTVLIYKIVPSHTIPSIIPDGKAIFIQSVPIKADIYLPPSPLTSQTKLALFIHGGGWVHSNRTDYGPPLFNRLLNSGFIICSLDYRLCPETHFSGTCEDVRDIEGWLKNDLQALLQKDGHDVEIEGDSIVVIGASAGAHLALLTVSSSSPQVPMCRILRFNRFATTKPGAISL